MITVEICTPSRQSAEAAKAGGAQRVELCRDLEVGGLTPSAEDIEYCVRTLGLRTHVLVRPRPGDFCYSEAEVAEIERTVMQCKALGAYAVVVGFLTADGRVDVALTRRIAQLAAPMEVTFHRAFDRCRDPRQALEQIISLGFDRILTSGAQPTAEQGISLLKELHDQAADRIIILAGCGVNEGNIRKIHEQTGIREFHFSAREKVLSHMRFTNPSVYMGSPDAEEDVRMETTERRVRATIDSLLT